MPTVPEKLTSTLPLESTAVMVKFCPVPAGPPARPVMVKEATTSVAVPLRLIVCVAGLPLRALSDSTAEPWMAPGMVGVKLRLRLQLAPVANERLVVQSCGLPEPST